MARDERADVLVVGSGGGGLVAALRAAAAGLNPLVIEKSDVVGGTTALSHGALWLPHNPLMEEAGLQDSVEDGVRYLQAVVGDQGPATSVRRQTAYIEGGRRLIAFLRERASCSAWSPTTPTTTRTCPARARTGACWPRR